MIELEVGGVPWFAGTRRYTSANAAIVAFDRLNHYGQKVRGELHIGAYRHFPEDHAQHLVTIVGVYPGGVEKALEILEGEPYELDRDLLERLVWRRAQVVASMVEGDAAPGTYRFPHPGGVQIDKHGNVTDV